jgi:2-oxo-3-hexenedioate decarboxylase
VKPTEAAAVLRTARGAGTLVDPFSDALPELDEAWGYEVQEVDRAQRLGAGERVVGAKLGLTSLAKQQRMGVDRPIVGFLTDAMLVAPAEVGPRLATWVQPRVEPEIAFVTSRDIDAPVLLAEVSSYVETVLLAAELLDSRFSGYRFRLPDVVADNTSAAGVVLAAERHRLASVGDLLTLRCEVRVDGQLAHEATGAAILGDPLRSLVVLADHVARHGQVLPAGSLVLAGALTDAEPLETGRRYELTIDGLGSLSLTP